LRKLTEKGDVLVVKTKELILKYGCNPHQKPARVYAKQGDLPFEVLNGNPGYINLLDAFNSWQLVKELEETMHLPAAASFKHVSPAGAAVGIPLTPELKKAYQVENIELSPVAAAYARARGADRMSSFGDWAAISAVVDLPTAQILSRAVSDGVIAPGYTSEALELLRQKRKGGYNVIQIDSAYQPEELEVKEVFGVVFEQKRNNLVPDLSLLQNVVTRKREFPDTAVRDLVIAMIALKYTQSNSVCFAKDGQIIGVGAGQQSRIHCTRLAASKADVWYLRQHPSVLSLKFNEGVKGPDRDNAVDQFLRDDLSEAEERELAKVFAVPPVKMTSAAKKEWLLGLKGVALGSDAFFPFRDNIDRARQSGVEYIVQPGGSVRDDLVIEACDQYGMVMAFSGVRLFHH
jgi:phosphoribosylaminoimidazolecarboxamide formyltransferase/IMP cyclohydrolase